jgi:hypothetical protein
MVFKFSDISFSSHCKRLQCKNELVHYYAFLKGIKYFLPFDNTDTKFWRCFWRHFEYVISWYSYIQFCVYKNPSLSTIIISRDVIWRCGCAGTTGVNSFASCRRPPPPVLSRGSPDTAPSSHGASENLPKETIKAAGKVIKAASSVNLHVHRVMSISVPDPTFLASMFRYCHGSRTFPVSHIGKIWSSVQAQY